MHMHVHDLQCNPELPAQAMQVWEAATAPSWGGETTLLPQVKAAAASKDLVTLKPPLEVALMTHKLLVCPWNGLGI